MNGVTLIVMEVELVEPRVFLVHDKNYNFVKAIMDLPIFSK